ncbi:MAG: two-component system sensor histidine kinase NtrB [Candidatus Sulfotelmatobacter sp.]
MSAVAELTTTTDPRKGGLNAEFLSWFQNAPLGLAWCDAQGRVMALNPAMEQALGDLNSPGPLHLSDLFPGQNREWIAELLSGKRDNFQIEGQGNEHLMQPVRWSVWRVSQCGGSDYIVAAAGTLSSPNQHFPEADRFEAVGRLTGGVAHDFNNLLTGVLLYCDLLLGTLAPDDRACRYAEEIRKAGFEASELVRQLLSLAKPARGYAKAVCVNDIADGMRNFLTRLAGENIELMLHLDPSLGRVQMDPARAQQVLLNLVLNARDAMPRGGQITVETRDCKVEMLANSSFNGKSCLRCVLLVVADNGAGMDMETRERMFEPFFTTKASQGTGLGLANVRDIVSRHGGLIHVESALGKGTRISVLLPALLVTPARDSANPNAANPNSENPDTGNPDTGNPDSRNPGPDPAKSGKLF